jgi:hypothetical protein
MGRVTFQPAEVVHFSTGLDRRGWPWWLRGLRRHERCAYQHQCHAYGLMARKSLTQEEDSPHRGHCGILR